MIRPLVVAGFLLLAFATIPSGVAAADCTMSAVPDPGRAIDVTGAGYPADADVTFVIVRNGVRVDSQTLRSDAAGSFSTSVDAGPGRGGAYTLIATVGSCKAVADVLAVETAGGAGGGTRPTQPATDVLTAIPSTGDAGDAPLTTVALILVAAAVGLMVAARILDRASASRRG